MTADTVAGSPPPAADGPEQFGMQRQDYQSLDEGDQELLRTASHQGTLAPHPSSPRASNDNGEKPAAQKSQQSLQQPFIVHWDGPNDPENPLNWSKTYRWFLTVLMGLLTLNSSFTSSVPSGTVIDGMEYFHVSQEVMTLAITAYVIGFCLGPMVFAPLSEHVGRWPTFCIALTAYTAFNLGCALCKNIGSLIIFRLLAGCFASAPLTNCAAVISDVWDANTRGTAIAIFALAPFAGPALGPTISGAIYVTGTSWRWTYWVCTIFSGVCTILAIFLVKETYAPVLLARKAQRLRKETGDDRYLAPIELVKIEPKEFFKKTCLKPFIMLIEEPMLLAITLYTSFIYGVLYMLFEAFPLTFGVVYKLNMLKSGLCFLPFFVGGAGASFVTIFWVNPRYIRDASTAPMGMLPAEARLPISYIGAPMITISAFWLGWTCYPSISIWCPLISTTLLGWGFIWVFQPLFNYIIDTYLLVAASAMAANTVIRSLFGAAFPLFTTQMFNRLGLHWGYTLVAFISLVLAPVPVILGYYGPKLRAMSKNSMTPEEVAAVLGIELPKKDDDTHAKDEELAAPSAPTINEEQPAPEKQEEALESPATELPQTPATAHSPVDGKISFSANHAS